MNWPMIISHRLHAFHLQAIFRYNYKSNDVFIHLIHYKVYLTALKISKLKWIV